MKITYECQTLRLPGNSRVGGLVEVEEADGFVVVRQLMPIGGTNGTEWQTHEAKHDRVTWDRYSDLILSGCKRVS